MRSSGCAGGSPAASCQEWAEGTRPREDRPHDRDLRRVHGREDRRRVPSRGHRAEPSTTCPTATWSSTSSGRASTTRTTWPRPRRAGWPASRRSCPASTSPARCGRATPPAIAPGDAVHRPRLRPRRRAPRRVRPGGPRARGSGSCPLPDGLTAREAMVVGTAGYTAALSVLALLDHGLDAGVRAPCSSPARPAASAAWRWRCSPVSGSRSPPAPARPTPSRSSAGSAPAEIIDRDELTDPASRCSRSGWAGAVDAVGRRHARPTCSPTLAPVGAVAASGNVGGADLPTTVLPFILRGVTLFGIDSARHPDRASTRGVGAHRHRPQAGRARRDGARRRPRARRGRARRDRSRRRDRALRGAAARLSTTVRVLSSTRSRSGSARRGRDAG